MVAPHPSALERALSWLAAAPAADALRDLAPLRRHLAAIGAVDINPLQYFRIVDLFQTRAGFTASTVKPLLLDATLPVAAQLRTIAKCLMDIHGALATAYLRVLRCSTPQQLADLGQTPVRLCALGLANLEQKFEVAQFVSSPVTDEFWRQAQAFHELLVMSAAHLPADEVAAAERPMKAMLALFAAQPDGLSPRETAFLAEYLRGHAASVQIHRLGAKPVSSDDGGAAAAGLPEAAVARRLPGSNLGLRFSCQALSRLVASHLSRLDQGEGLAAVGLTGESLTADYRSVLTRAMEHWQSAPKRQSHRRRSGYRVQVCTHLAALWQQLRQPDDPSQTEVDLPASDWMIINESASGYAIMHVSGELAGLLPGSAIGVQAAAGKPWTICIVRWARSENPEHIELGLEIVAPHAEPVRVVRSRGGDSTQLSAFLLPPLPGLGRGESLLTARGYFSPEAFTLITESAAHIQVTECVPSQISMHTASVEIFEFDRVRG